MNQYQGIVGLRSRSRSGEGSGPIVGIDRSKAAEEGERVRAQVRESWVEIASAGGQAGKFLGRAFFAKHPEMPWLVGCVGLCSLLVLFPSPMSLEKR